MTDAMSSLLDRAELDRTRVSKLLARGLEGADDGELFLEYRQAEALVFDNGRLKQATYDTAQGFGLRAVKGEAVGYAHASDVSEQAISRAVEAVRAVQGGYSGSYSQAPARTNVRLYGDDNPLGSPSFETKVSLLEEIDALRARERPARTAGVGVVRRDLAGGRNPARRRRDLSRRAPAGARQRLGGRGRRRPAGDRAATAMAGARAISASSKPAPGRARSTTRCARRWSISKRCRRRPASSTSCSAPAGPA